MSRSKSRRRRPRKKKSINKKIILIIALLAIFSVIIVGYNMLSNDGSNENMPSNDKVLLETSMGDILIELRDDMPITTQNFKNLVQQGVYDDTIFHRVIADFMIQGGDPTGTGYGDPSIPNIQDELSENPENKKNVRGTIAMAKKSDDTGQVIPDSGSSQFFINVVNNSNEYFDANYPVFGEVIEGMDVVDRISEVATDADDKPLEPVTLIRAQLVD